MGTWSGSCLLHELKLRLHIVDHRDRGEALRSIADEFVDNVIIASAPSF